jgi:hypothetical protein
MGLESRPKCFFEKVQKKVKRNFFFKKKNKRKLEKFKNFLKNFKKF